MRISFIITAVAAAAAFTAKVHAQGSSAQSSCAIAAAPGVSEQTLTSGGRERSYRLFVPPKYDGRTPLPLVLDLHGSGGTADRQFFTLDAASGELLWQTRLNGDVSGAPVSYELGGKQYIAVASGGRAAPTTTLGRLVGVDVPQGSGVMWVFALPGGEPAEVPRPTRRDQPQRSLADGVFTAGQAAQGKQLFEQHCSSCHEAASYIGASFAAKWGDGTLGDVYQDIALAMPPANAGGLTPVTYASIVAYFVSESGHPAGRSDLPGDAAQLRSIAIGAASAP